MHNIIAINSTWHKHPVYYCCSIGFAKLCPTPGRQRDRETERQGDRETGRQGDRETGRQGDGETGRQGDREMGFVDSLS